MNLKAKIQAAASRAANGPGDPKAKKTSSAPNKAKADYEKQITETINYFSKIKKATNGPAPKEAPMSSMPTLRPTSVSNPNRPVARPYGEMTASKTKKRG
jgi:hypothetical protein